MNLRIGWPGRMAACAAFLILAFVAGAQERMIHLRNERIRTARAGLTPAQAADATPVDGLQLLQFNGPLRSEWREQLRALDVELLRYVPDDAFVVRLRGVSRSRLRALPFVHWVGDFRPEHKLHRALPAAAPDAELEVSVVLAPAAAALERAELLRSLRPTRPETRHRLGSVLRGRISARSLQEAARSPAVLWIEPAPKMRLFDEVSSRIVAGDGGINSTLMQDLGYDGRGVTVAVADSGLDSGDVNDLHPDLAGRVTAMFHYGTLTDAADEHSHGTHCAGIIAGNGTTGEKDANGHLFGLGVAPRVNLIAQRLFGAAGDYQPPPTFETLTRDAVRAGADIGSNSWGDDTQGRYDVSAMEFDALVRDADALALGDQPYILEFSAGNAGPGVQTIGSPAVAKNVIATGASQNNRFDLPIPEFAIYDTGQETMADFSSRGPCEDGRIKPDLVAPGTWIASLRSVYADDNNAWAPISDRYLYQGGTSQAGPQVSGAAAVFVQFWRETRGVTPSPALVKAALINSAADMDDSIETGPVPNSDEGWGRVDLPALLASTRQYDFTDQTELLVTGGAFERRLLVSDSGEPLKITLAYTDVPGFPGALPALVNDLDLEVIGPDGTLYRGNQFDLGESVANPAAADSLNNVEAVHLAAPLPGEYLVRVRARNVPDDARVDTAERDQDFALVASGALVPGGVGVVSFDRRAYTAPGQIVLRLFDQNLAGAATATVRLTSSTEPTGEVITLRAAGSSGTFTATVATATGPALANGRLEISQGDVIEAVYTDANPPATRRYTARADLRPPVIAEVFTTNRFGRVLVSFTTDEESTSLVLFGTNALTLAVTNRFFETEHELAITNVRPGLIYRFAVVAEDRAGNRATNDNDGAGFFFISPAPPTILLVEAYHDDLFEVPPLAGYTEALDRLGVPYDVWDKSLDGPVTAELLQPYRAVIWRVAEFSLGTTWSADDARAVTNYLAGGGSLLLASMEFLSRLEELGFTTFARDVLQVESFEADAGAPHISGAPGEAIGAGIDVTLDYAPYEDEIKELLGITADASDTLVATANGAPIFLSSGEVVGVRSPRTGQDRPGRVVFLSFPLDAVPMGTGVGNNRPGLLRNILNFLAPAEGTSSLALDREVYTVPGVVTVEVEDLTRAGQETVGVRCTSPRQPGGVDLALFETARRGVFRGALALATAASGAAGELEVRHGDQFSVSYPAGDGPPVTATADVETNAPVVFNVAIEAGYTDAFISLETSEPTDALVQYGDSPDRFPINFTAYDGRWRTTHELTLDRLEPRRTYYVRVICRDRAGNATVEDNAGQLYVFTTLTPLATPWADDLENGDEAWTVYTAEGSEVQWALGRPAGAGAFSPENAWGSNLEGQSISLAESFLISPAILLTGGNYATLRFQQNYDFLEQSEFDIAEYGEVLLITNAYTSPVPLGTVTEFSESWERAEFDLTPYLGQVVYVVWHYVLISFDSRPRAGWLVDDISVTVSNIVPGTIQITNNLWQARYLLTGPANRAGQGAFQVLNNMPAGQYTLTFGEVPFFLTPPTHSGTLAPGGTLTLGGHYSFTDTNGNALPDPWEESVFGVVAPDRTGEEDTDGDGHADRAEFAAGTDPKSRDSRLMLARPAILPDGRLRLEWTSVSGRGYRVETSAEARTWTPVSAWIRAQGAATGFTVPAPLAGGSRFFRVEVQP
ncbi:MAG TPA: S8 family serine peptidase [Methylomirabilota bacterium]|nr:S8 family serine peptidase [Methylomirabilota bacterium]